MTLKDPAPKWADGVTVRTLTQEAKDAVSRGYLPLNASPTEKYTPEYFRDLVGVKAPIITIKKPTLIDDLKRTEESKIDELVKAIRDARAAAKRNAESKQKAEEESRPAPPDEPVEVSPKIVAEAMIEASEYIVDWEMTAANGDVIPFTKGADGKISDSCLDLLSRARMLWEAITYRVCALKTISEAEVESFASSQASATD